MFANRGFGPKLTAALIVIVALGIFSALRGDRINPPLWRCAAEPSRWHGTPLWISRAQVVDVRRDEFSIDVNGLRMTVRGTAPAAAGSVAELRAEFDAEGPRLKLIRGRPLPAHARLRWAVEAVSLLVLGLVVLNLVRHFAFRPKVLQIEGT